MAAAAVLPLLAYGGWSILSLRSGAQQAVTEGNLNVARRTSEQIELYVNGSLKILKAVAAFVPLRLEDEHEAQGIDLAQHGETGYNL